MKASWKLTTAQKCEIKRLLNERELTQRQIAALFGVRQTAISALKVKWCPDAWGPYERMGGRDPWKNRRG